MQLDDLSLVHRTCTTYALFMILLANCRSSNKCCRMALGSWSRPPWFSGKHTAA